MRRRYRLLLSSLMVPALAATAILSIQAPSSGRGVIKSKVWQRALDVELGKVKANPKLAKLSSGVMYAILQVSGVLDRRARDAAKSGSAPTVISSPGTRGCSRTFTNGSATNTRVNQDCSLRRQAEETIAVNPTNPQNMIAGQNDSRAGYNQCGFDWTFDGGKTWGDQLPPFHQTILADGRIGDFCSDPTAVFDTEGDAYIAGLELSLDGTESAIVVAKSNAGIGGAFYHSPDSSLGAFQTFADTPMGVVVDTFDPNGCIANDKELMSVDNTEGSKGDTLYMTWSRFNFCTGQGIGADSPIYFSQSTDEGLTWTDGIEISGSNATYCTVFSGESDPNACDQDQGSDPIVGPDGTIYVSFNNGNTPTLGINQQLVVSCPASADCSQKSSWTAPSKIADDYAIQPTASVPDPVTGCPGGRQCLPPNGYRMNDYGSISADGRGNLYFVWSDGRNLAANCQGDYAVATPPCDNDVFYSYSTDGGSTWSPATDVTPATSLGHTSQWQAWGSAAPNGRNLYAAFYDRSYGSCEGSGCNDITLATIAGPRSPGPVITYRRVTTASMPNLVVANSPYQAGFLGDYLWVSTPSNGNPYIVWADTRGHGGAVEEDVYFSR